MQKDVIYIDVEDDITAIIGKVKAAKSNIVALVPPKRIGAIQSAVNLKLVHRAAEQADKRLVLISNNTALSALAASASIPVAKNLQSKPELAEISALDVDEGEDVIDGTAPADIEATPEAAEGATAETPAQAVATKTALGATAVKKTKVKIPNFDAFRKKLFFIILGAVLLTGFLVWAIAFAPHATVTITARSSSTPLSTQVTLGDSLSTDLKNGTIKTLTKTTKKAVSKDFAATGKKDVGEKATGTIVFSTNNISNLGTTIPAGTKLTSSSGATYTTDTSVTMTISNHNGAPTGVTAAASGTKYNGASGAASGAPSGIAANFDGSTAGGTDKEITVVTQSDFDTASTDIVSNDDSDAAKAALTKEFGDEYVILDGSFKKDTGDVKSSPKVGEEAANDKATLAGDVKFTLTAVPKSEMGKFLDAYFAQQIDGKADQKVYDNGLGGVNFTDVSKASKGYTATVTTNGKIGPKIDEAELKESIKGQRLGEIQAIVQQTNGVENVDVRFSPFWVRTAPNDTKRIEIKFKVND